MRKLFFLIFAAAELCSSCAIEKYFKKIADKSSMESIASIDFIYMINLDKRPEKFSAAKQVLAPYGICPCRFSAVNGWELECKALQELGVIYMPGLPEGPLSTVFREEDGKEFGSFEIMKEPGIAYYCHSLSRGAIGCILSHLSVLQDAYDSGYATIWVMEDDIRVISDPHEISSLIAALDRVDPAWDIFFTDFETKSSSGERVYNTWIRPRPLVRQEPLAYYQERTYIADDFMKIGLRFGAYSMVIRREGIGKILSYYKQNRLFFPYDMEFCYAPGIRMYQCTRDIVTTISGALSDNGTPAYTP